MPGPRARRGGDAQVAADIGDDLCHRTVIEVVIHLRPIQPFQQFAAQVVLLVRLNVLPLDGIVDVAQNPRPCRGAGAVACRWGATGLVTRRASPMVRRTVRASRSKAWATASTAAGSTGASSWRAGTPTA